MNETKFANLATRGGHPVHLERVTVTGDMRGLVFEARVEQRFSNPGSTHIELVYTFPLPWRAVLLGVEVQLGEQRLTGAVVENKRAEAQYEEALSEGHAAIMLERTHDHGYSLNLGNLAPGESCVITLRYAQTLQFEQHGLRLMVPTVIAPRYGDAVRDGGLQPHQAPQHTLLADHPFALTVRLHGELASAHVACPSHPVSMAFGRVEAGDMLTVSLARGASLDRDFVLVLEQLRHDSIGIAARDFVQPEGVAVLASFCPRLPPVGRIGTAIKILVDCSGSMQGDSIDAARRALQAIVLQLGAGDRFSLSRFGDTVAHRARGLWTATETTRLAAQRWVGELQADMGGTEMETALASTFALADTDGGDVLLVTDGQIQQIDRVIDRATATRHRLFIVGIGSSPALSHLHRLAEASGGACDFVAAGEAVEPAVLRMFARLRSPRLDTLRLQWPDGVVPRWVSPLPKAIFNGDTVNVFAVLPQPPTGPLRLQGLAFGAAVPQEIGCVAWRGEVTTDDTLPRIAASVRLASLGAAQSPTAAEDAMQLALSYQLVTEQTRFLLVHERAEGEKALDMPVLHVVPQMVPAGWGGTGSLMTRRMRAIQHMRAMTNSARMEAVLYAKTASLLEAVQPSRMTGPPPVCSDDGATVTQRPAGLTPAAASRFACGTPQHAWPNSYAGLAEAGFATGVLDWLATLPSRYAHLAPTECDVVTAWLELLRELGLHDAFAPDGGTVADALLSIARLLRSQHPKDALCLLATAMAIDMDGMEADHWPAALCDVVAIRS